MPSESPAVPAQTEKPQHYLYLKEFRTQQCPLFLQHKCTQHRPFTCFHWHFMNQRRRRPIRKRDGTFNYSPDVYCTKYDDTNGLCPDGDECPFLHRTAGDTERRYHLRYYKTGTCVYETDSKGNCVKNGPHCAFAHGAHDLRPPIYDIRELQTIETPDLKASLSSSSGTPSSLEKDKILAEDPKWNDTNFVLANYKTEPCKRPPRLCRQGYACPSFHNTRDRRRSPKKCKYRSTPCPNVKHGDDWGDPTQCENGDNCAYCHTRTEQQFHPEIYKSTKCNDMVQTGYCPRGPFCAFAHVEHRELDKDEVNSLSSSLSAGIPTSGFGAQSIPIGIPGGIQRGSIGSLSQSPPSPFGSFSHSLLTGNQKHESGEQNLSLLGYHNHNKFSDLNSMSPRSGPGGPHSPLYSSSNLSNSSQGADMQKLREEFQHYKTRQEHWEQAYSQAKSACEAWKREAEESLRKAKSAEEEKAQAFKQRDEVGRISKMQLDLEKYGGGSNSVRLLHQVNEIETIPIPQLRQIQQQLRMDVDKLEKVIVYQQNMKCIMCQDRKRTVTCSPCNHRVLCDTCVSKSTDCPMCHVQRTNYRL
uniref:RING finger protein unkempt n=1 Tax=Magallana gigas TaxID=29159 RepID=K1PTD5_MAGGI